MYPSHLGNFSGTDIAELIDALNQEGGVEYKTLGGNRARFSEERICKHYHLYIVGLYLVI